MKWRKVECRVAFATEKNVPLPIVEKSEPEHLITQKESTVKTGNGDQPITRRKWSTTIKYQ